MTTTGPLPAIREDCSYTEYVVPRSDARLALLHHMGAVPGSMIRYHYPTADAVIDPDRGVLLIAVDPEPDPADWAAVCGLIQAVGFTDGSLPHRKDPGEPDQDPLSGVFTWRLEYADQCIWCDGKGTSGGCPLCQKGG